MSTLLMERTSFISKTVSNYHRSQVLKSKENIFKPKCNKALKKKLKKYKLRRDGQEDPDIIDVSQTLITSLRIKSPNNQLVNCRKAIETIENRPHNYLTKMVRLKKTAVMVEPTSTDDSNSNNNTKEENISLTPKGDQDKKQTDAFKLLMDSRNKSIGTNSPGKEKCEDENEAREKIEKKEIRAKRNLSLTKMAQAKGSQEKIEIEEYREQIVKRKMDYRAERLKDMIVNQGPKNKKKEAIKTSVKGPAAKIDSPLQQEVVENIDTLSNKSPILKTFGIFKDIKSPTKNIKKISEEDEEFLKKLSPSIKKKENMLCYFQKISKDSETSPDGGKNESKNADQLVIKVKIKSKLKVKKKKQKHISDKEIDLPVNNDTNLNNNSQSHSSALNNDCHKRKQHPNKDKDKEETRDRVIHNGSGLCSDDSRPKRNTKRPVKYADDFQLTSSDEELYIITPKKKRKNDSSQDNLKPINDNKFERIKNGHCKLREKDIKHKPVKIKELKKKAKYPDEENTVAPKEKTKATLIPKKVTKLAPLFVTKPQLDPAALEAKQKFLHSGVPSQLKKNSIQQTYTMATNEFQTVVHVQSLYNANPVRINKSRNYIDITYDEDIHLRQEKDQFKKLLDFTVMGDHQIPMFQNNVDLTLEDIKKSYPRFPVYRTYHLLKGKSKGEFKDCVYPDLDNSVELYNNMVDINNINPDKLHWTDKYKPTTQKQVIGNFESIRELKRWLVTWTENAKSKRNKDKESDSSDFYQSDTDSRETMRNINNLLVITGGVGTGKTLSVYAVAAELAIKVIEVNASSKRTGKIMLQDLQEATQSHKVDRGKSSTECSQKSQELKSCENKLKVMKKRGRKKKIPDTPQINPKIKSVTKKEITDVTVSQENIRTGMSLILIDDADIVFDQDDGFCSAISQLIQTSKRPVILVTSSLTCPHLQKFINLAKIIKMRPFLPRMLGTWLDIMCLVDNSMCSPGLGAKTLDFFKGDIRKTINYLQFYMTSQKHLYNGSDSGMSQSEVVTRLNVDDENSCMSWMDNEGWGATNSDDNTSNFVRKQLQQLHSFTSLTNLDVWWNLPNLLNYSSELKEDEKTIEKGAKRDKSRDINKMNMISVVLETISMTDCLENFNISNKVNITSGPWHSCESASIIDSENFTSYNRNNDCINDIAYELMTKSISEAQRALECEDRTEIINPNMAIQRERDKVASQYKTLTSNLSPSAILDRRALALDYWPSCRNICRTEKSKTDNNSKRNNRFCHYLKSLNVLCRNDYFDNLSEGLIYSNKE